ncbi:DUF3267 domain-containing protein [Pseudoduganella sp. HUAS MS19]
MGAITPASMIFSSCKYMKFLSKIPPPDLPPARPQGSIRLNSRQVQLYTLAVGLLTVPAVYLAWRLAFGPNQILGIFDRPSWVFIGATIGILLAHELAHLLAHPAMGFSPNSFIGFDRKFFVFFVGCHGAQSKWRYIVMAMMPIILLTLLPFGVAIFYPVYIPELAWCSIFNMAGAGTDLFVAVSVIVKMPKDCIIQGSVFGYQN